MISFFCKRECNEVTHELAVFGHRAGGVVSSWLEQAPDFVSAIVASDVAVRA